MRIAFIGDLAFFGKNALENNTKAFEYFAPVTELLNEYDLVIGNLETPFVTNQKPYALKSAHIKSHPKNVELLKFLNVDCVTLANNHIYDFGELSLKLTCNTLDEHGISYIGINDRDFLYEEANNKLAFHAYCCYTTNPIGMDKGINVLDIPDVENRMKKYNSSGYLNVLNLHFGQEHVHTPNYYHVEMARRFSKLGPYIMAGHHPHVIQGIEEYEGAYIAYSLGNLCFDDVYSPAVVDPIFTMSEFNKKAIIWEVEVQNNKLISNKPIPVYLGEDELELNRKGVLSELITYSEALQMDKESYIKERSDFLSSFLKSRIKSNNLKWFLTRIRPSTYKRYKAAHKNRRLFSNHVSQHIDNWQ